MTRRRCNLSQGYSSSSALSMKKIMTARPWLVWSLASSGDGHMEVVLGFDDRDSVAACLVQKSKVAFTVN